MDKPTEIELLKKALVREKLARKEAESIMESKSLQLYSINLKLNDLIANTNKFPKENPSPVMRFSAQGHVLMYSNKAGNGIVEYLDKKENIETKKCLTEVLDSSFNKIMNQQVELNR
mgnify:CR=1 FL=1